MTKKEVGRQLEDLNRFEQSFGQLVKANVGLKLSTIHEVEEKVIARRKGLLEIQKTAPDEDEGLLVASFIQPALKR